MGGLSPQTWVQMAKHSAMTTHLAANAANSAIKGRKFQKRADAAKPPLVDQKEAAFLNDIEMRRKNIDTGVGYSMQERQADQQTAGTQANILRASGGDTGAAIQGLLMAQRMGANTYNEGAVAQAAQQQNFYTGLASSLTSKISDRKMQLQLADRAQYLAQAMQYKQQAAAQGTALLNHMLDTDSAGLGGMMGGKPATTQSVNGVAPSGQGSKGGDSKATNLSMLNKMSSQGGGGNAAGALGSFGGF